MRVHHLNCGTMGTTRARFVAHVLLVETDRAGLVLIDSGFGLEDIAAPGPRIGPIRRIIHPALDPAETAARQVEAMGHRRDDVRHIVLTHLDVDHAGGLADFPGASVHVTAAEAEAALRSPSFTERRRYRPAQWAHGARFVEHGDGGERWRGFPAARELTEIAPGIVLLPMPGHTRGHAGVAVDAGDHWVVHCGDAYYHRGTIEGSPVPRAVTAGERIAAVIPRLVAENHRRLAEIHARGDEDLVLVCSHDSAQFEACRRRARAAEAPAT